MKKLTKNYLNSQFDKYLERPFVILDFVIFATLLLPMIFEFSEKSLKAFHFIDVSIWLLILLEVIFKLLVVPSLSHYLTHDWEDIICAVLPMLPNFKIIRELRYIHINQIKEGLKVVRIGAFAKRIERRLSLILNVRLGGVFGKPQKT